MYDNLSKLIYEYKDSENSVGHFIEVIASVMSTFNWDLNLRDRSQALVRGPDSKRGSLTFLTLVRGALKKLPQIL